MSLLETRLLVMRRLAVEGFGSGTKGGMGRPVVSLSHLKKFNCVPGSSSVIL